MPISFWWMFGGCGGRIPRIERGGKPMKCEKFFGISTEEACLKQQKSGKILCRTCTSPLTGESAPLKEAALKHCNKCGQDKPVSAFSPDKKSLDRLRGYCKLCTAALSMEYLKKKKAGAPAPEAENKKLAGPSTAPRKKFAPVQEKAGPPPLRITVNFADYPNLFDFIMTGPKEYLRSPENMILYGVTLAMKEAQQNHG
jgi:hypothetical protein